MKVFVTDRNRPGEYKLDLLLTVIGYLSGWY